MQYIITTLPKLRRLLVAVVLLCTLGGTVPKLYAQNWVSRNAVPTTASLYGSLYANSTYFICGNGGALLSSYDGITWSQASSGTAQRIRGLTYGAGSYVAICQNDSILTSTSGGNWIRSALGSKAALQSICFGNSTFVIAGDSGRVFTSANPVGTWTKRTTASKARLNCIVWANTQFVAAGDSGTVLTSPTGITWTKQTSQTTRRISAIAYTIGKYVAVGDSGTVLSSDNGQLWTVSTGVTRKNLLGAAHNGSRFVAVGPSDSIWYSTDGSNWQGSLLSADPFTYTPSFLNTVCATSTQFVAAGRDGIVLTSASGTSFTERSDVTLSLLDVCVLGSTYLAVGAKIKGSSPSGAIFVSGNGTGWTPVDLNASAQILRCAARNATAAVVMGETDTILTSTNLLNWTKSTVSGYRDFTDIVWNGSYFTAINTFGHVLTSTNGTTWIESADLGCMLLGLCWNGSQFLAVGDTGTIFTSSNAIQWTRRNSASTAVLYSAAWNGTRYVVVGENATTLTSTNAITWTENQLTSISPFNRLFSVCHNGTSFIAAGENGTLLSSINGTTWNVLACPTSASLYSVAGISSTNMAAVGSIGAIISTQQMATEIRGCGSPILVLAEAQLTISNDRFVRFSVERAGFVSLKIFDLQGRLVQKPVGEKYSAGNFSVQLKSMAAGSYYAEFLTASQKIYKTFVISK